MARPAQIQAFKAELLALAEEGITLDEATLARIRAHHAALLAGSPDERLSIGMRLVRARDVVSRPSAPGLRADERCGARMKRR